MVVFIAISAGQIAAPHRNDMREHDMISRKQRARNERGLAKFPFEKSTLSHFSGEPEIQPEKNMPFIIANARTLTMTYWFSFKNGVTVYWERGRPRPQ